MKTTTNATYLNRGDKWVTVKPVYSSVSTRLLYVVDAERGTYPVQPSSLKGWHQLTRKQQAAVSHL